jgi:4-hydroxy-tetrahydrodipicolinate reductase
MALQICVAGATGWVGKALCKAILRSSEFTLCGAVARKAAGQDIGEFLGMPKTGIKITAKVEEALTDSTNVLIDYTSSREVKGHALHALRKHIPVVIGTSGLIQEDFAELEFVAKTNSVGVIASGNFALTACLAKHFSTIAARYLSQWEIIDYANAEKLDVPSGTGREVAEAMGAVKQSKLGRLIAELNGPKEARGATISGSQVHSVRLNGIIFGFEVLFGQPDERLTIKHEAGAGAEPYVGGTLLAASRVVNMVGLTRGLDRLLFSDLAKPV